MYGFNIYRVTKRAAHAGSAKGKGRARGAAPARRVSVSPHQVTWYPMNAPAGEYAAKLARVESELAALRKTVGK